MDIKELQLILQKLNIGKVTNRQLAEIWGIDETSVSRKKRLETQLNSKDIDAIETHFKINLSKKAVKNKDDVVTVKLKKGQLLKVEYEE